ncbi:hypothetical protein ILYODFUR_021117 [Ilyodon furcidens]|uniref:Homeobox domain-containing protein n=1 Tax=Ilyodon furcidens TaxID=33524 RepID=A0ABV0V4U3_9TELE
MARTTIQLFELNQRTISQWFSRRQKHWERSVLEQWVSIVPAPAVAEQPLLPAKELSFWFRWGKDSPSATTSLRTCPTGVLLLLLTTQISILPSTSSAQLPHPPPVVPRTTAYRRRKAAEAATAEGVVAKQKRKQQQPYLCRECNQHWTRDTPGSAVCPTVPLFGRRVWRNGGRK